MRGFQSIRRQYSGCAPCGLGSIEAAQASRAQFRHRQANPRRFGERPALGRAAGAAFSGPGYGRAFGGTDADVANAANKAAGQGQSGQNVGKLIDLVGQVIPLFGGSKKTQAPGQVYVPPVTSAEPAGSTLPTWVAPTAAVVGGVALLGGIAYLFTRRR